MVAIAIYYDLTNDAGASIRQRFTLLSLNSDAKRRLNPGESALLATFRLKISFFRGSKVTMLHPMGARVTGVD